jgi:hypothetical protein
MSDLLTNELENKEKITIVTGVSRSGTSLNILIPHELGMEIAGNRHRKNRIQDPVNPTGFWELSHVVTTGWLVLNWPGIEHSLIVDYEDVLKDPETEVSRIAKFVDRPVTKNAIDCVDQSLWRSKGIDEDEFANKIYNGIKNSKFDELRKDIIKYFTDNHIKYKRV